MKGKAQVFASEGWKLLEARFEELFPQEVEPDLQPALVQDFGTRESGQEPTEKWMWARDRRLALVEAAEAEAPGGLPGIGQRVNARAVLAPSAVEGFDLPAVEACALGAPLIASDIPPHRELTPDAELIDPLDGLGWLQAIERAALTPPPPRPAYQPPRWADHFRIVADTLALKRDGGLAGDRQGL